MPRLTAVPLDSVRLRLEPLRIEHAEAASTALADERLHTWIGDRPADADELRARYTRQSRGRSDDGTQDWLNWIVRDRASAAIAGTVQATVHRARRSAEVAWVVAVPFQGRGIATEAAATMIDWLRSSPTHRVEVVIAHLHPEHHASIGVARHLGLHPTEVVVDGEVRWASTPPGRNEHGRSSPG